MVSIYSFDHDHGVPAKELVDVLGGKGAGLAEMTGALGMNVPPGFTIALDTCRTYRATGWPDGLDTELQAHIDRLGTKMGRRFGDPHDPLLLAVRSGAPVSMPGMLDTVLNLGLNPQTVRGLAERSGDPRFAWDSYRRFLRMFATTVMGAPPAELPASSGGGSPEDVQREVELLRSRIVEVTGRPVPDDPFVQLREAVEAVFRSWDCERAQAYRAREEIERDLGTAVNVQAMVFGNRGGASGTGVVFTRDPATGEACPYGDYLPTAQGEDVVAGTACTMPIAQLRVEHPAIYDELIAVLRRLEIHYRDVCDVEFTVEQGRLWLLQTRRGKTGAVAAVRIAVDLMDDPEIGLSPDEALVRVPAELRERARLEVLARCADGGGPNLTTGLGASPGRASGRIALSSEAAADADEDVILVRAETSPEDVAGMAASVGILTTRGGLVSHAAVVARGWGIPAVVGAAELSIDDDGVLGPDGHRLRAGDVITIDGTTGQVWAGVVDGRPEESGNVIAEHLPHLLRLEELAAAQLHHTSISNASTEGANA